MKSTEILMNYDSFAATFSSSRRNHPWPELDAIIEDMKTHAVKSVLDVGCGNGRFLEEVENRELRIESYLGTDNSEGMIREAKMLYPEHLFHVIWMEHLSGLESQISKYDAIIFLASYHHLDTTEHRIKTLQYAKKFLAPHGRIYMTNWNLRDQARYRDSEMSEGEYEIKIWAYSRYYHGFTLGELESLFSESRYTIVEHRIFEWGKNLYSILQV